MTEPTAIKPDRVCLDCGKLFMTALASLDGETVVCPRCKSPKHHEYVKAEHLDIEVEVPKEYSHPSEDEAREIFDRVVRLTGWRELKVRLWMQLENPLLGNVSPEWMIMQGKHERLKRFIREAEGVKKGRE